MNDFVVVKACEYAGGYGTVRARQRTERRLDFEPGSSGERLCSGNCFTASSFTDLADRRSNHPANTPLPHPTSPGLFAQRQIASGDVFLTESPLLFVSLSHGNCCMCGRLLKPPLQPLACEACIKEGGLSVEGYCSSSCREAAWQHHHQNQCVGRRRGVADVTFVAEYDRCEALYLLAAGVARGMAAEQLKDFEAAARTSAVDLSLEEASIESWAEYIRDILERALHAAGEPQPCKACGCKELKQYASYYTGSAAPPSSTPPSSTAPTAGSGAAPRQLACECRWTWYRDLRRLFRANCFPVHSHPPFQAPKSAPVCCQAVDRSSAPEPAGVADGLAYYATARFINHCCAPNAAALAHATSDPWQAGSTLHVKALRTIEPGEEITVAYKDDCFVSDDAMRGSAMLTRERRRILMDSFGFVCNCNACRSGSRVLEKLPSVTV